MADEQTKQQGEDTAAQSTGGDEPSVVEVGGEEREVDLGLIEAKTEKEGIEKAAEKLGKEMAKTIEEGADETLNNFFKQNPPQTGADDAEWEARIKDAKQKASEAEASAKAGEHPGGIENPEENWDPENETATEEPRESSNERKKRVGADIRARKKAKKDKRAEKRGASDKSGESKPATDPGQTEPIGETQPLTTEDVGNTDNDEGKTEKEDKERDAKAAEDKQKAAEDEGWEEAEYNAKRKITEQQARQLAVNKARAQMNPAQEKKLIAVYRKNKIEIDRLRKDLKEKEKKLATEKKILKKLERTNTLLRMAAWVISLTGFGLPVGAAITFLIRPRIKQAIKLQKSAVDIAQEETTKTKKELQKKEKAFKKIQATMIQIRQSKTQQQAPPQEQARMAA